MKECQNQLKQGEANLNEVAEQKNNEDFLFFSALSINVPTDCNTWLIDSGASRHITGYREPLSDLIEKESNLHVVIGDDARYLVRGFSFTLLNLDSGISLHLSDIFICA